MRLNNNLLALISLALLTSSSLRAETTTFLGIQAVKIDTELDYDNGDEDYKFTSARLQYGADLSEEGVIGLEILTGDTDDVLDPFGTPFELKTDTAFGIFFNIGRPFYFRLAWTFWDTEYTNLDTDVTEEEEVSTFDFGIGYQMSLGSNLSLYADYVIRNSSANYPAHFIGSGDLDYNSELLSIGVNKTF